MKVEVLMMGQRIIRLLRNQEIYLQKIKIIKHHLLMVKALLVQNNAELDFKVDELKMDLVVSNPLLIKDELIHENSTSYSLVDKNLNLFFDKASTILRYCEMLKIFINPKSGVRLC